MGKYSLFRLAFKNIGGRFFSNLLSFISALIAIVTYTVYSVLIKFPSSAESLAVPDFLAKFNPLIFTFVIFIFTLTGITLFLVFQLTLQSRMKAFAVFSTFGAKGMSLFLVVFYEYLILILSASAAAVGGITAALYYTEDKISHIVTLPSDITELLILGGQSAGITAAIAFFTFLLPAAFTINRDPSEVLRSF